MLGEIASAAAIASSVNSIFGGGGGGQQQPPAFLTGYELKGTIGKEGIRGSLTGIDNSGKRHDAGTYTEENGAQYGSLFSRLFGESSVQVPLSMIVRAENFGASLVEDLTRALQAFAATHPEESPAMATQPSTAQLPTGSSLAGAYGTPVQSGTPAGAVPVGGIAASAAPASPTVAGVPAWVLLAVAAVLIFGGAKHVG